MLRTGECDVEGTYYSAHCARLVPFPESDGPPLVIGASGPKMMRPAARFADEWNGSTYRHPHVAGWFRPTIEKLEQACEDVGRDPSTLRRSLDLVVDTGTLRGEPRTGPLAPYIIGGTIEEIIDRTLASTELDIGTIRFLLFPAPPPEARPALVTELAELVEAAHAAG